MRDYINEAKLAFGQELQALSKVKFLILDNDGVMTDCKVNYVDGTQPFEISYNVLDGYGLIKLQNLGVSVAIISGRANPALEERCRVLGIPNDLIYQGISNKLECLHQIMAQHNLTIQEIAYIGDDIIDFKVIEYLTNGITVPNCHPLLSRYARYTTVNAGGSGAVREICDLITIAYSYQQAQRSLQLQQSNLETLVKQVVLKLHTKQKTDFVDLVDNIRKQAFKLLFNDLAQMGLNDYQASLLADFLLFI